MKKIRCAVYTRKSTEQGLEQDFNSLDAQREACEAFIKSQKALGWTGVSNAYDDGGLSGGTMDRPALQALLSDVEGGLVDMVVVYKVDRLTRSLADFAKIVERLDNHGASFASVTQQFNTSTSMGRMTLNVLMTFAQFEREVTAERIRDKIAASKKKGLWMGGAVPLGYDNIDKALLINEREAQTVRRLFELYLELGSVKALALQANQLGLRTKVRMARNKSVGGLPCSRGHLYQMLKNPLYAGRVVHKRNTYPGQHAAIIDQEIWDAVQALMEANTSPRARSTNIKDISLLTGLVYDERGDRLSPTHTKKNGKRYRYYISKDLVLDPSNVVAGWRLPAEALDKLVTEGLLSLLNDDARLIGKLGQDSATPQQLKKLIGRAAAIAELVASANPTARQESIRDIVVRVDLSAEIVDIQLDAGRITDDSRVISLKIPMTLQRRGVETKIIVRPRHREAQPDGDQILIRLIADTHLWFSQLSSGKARSVREIARLNKTSENDVSRFLPLAFLAPDIVEAIIAGEHPPDLSAERLKRLRSPPHSWAEQRQLLGFAPT